MAWVFALTSKGIRIALADTGVVHDANPDIGSFIKMAIDADQNHSESAKKSERVTSAKHRLWGYAERREGPWVNLANRPPSWLTRNAERNGWIIDEERAALVREIYSWSADGLGAQAICRRLNEQGIKPFGVWHRYEPAWGISAINAMLCNPAVEGDFVPEKGMFLGRSLSGFYPRIVDANLVSRARAGKAARRKVTGKRAATGTVNLFAGLTTCGECGSRAYVTTHNKKGRTYRYMRCESAREGRKCTNDRYYSYGEFEKTALDICLDLALDDRFFEATGELRELQVKKAEIEKAITDATRARAKNVRMNEQRDDVDQMLEDRIHELKIEIDSLHGALATVEQDIDRAAGKVGAAEHLKRVGDIRAAAGSDDENVREQARAKLVLALGAITQGVEIEVIDGERIFTLILKGGVLAVRILSDGKIDRILSDSLGRPLDSYLADQQREAIAPLIRRIEAMKEAA
jgi:hypothetical protein